MGTSTLIATTGNVTTINASNVVVSTLANVTSTNPATSTTTGALRVNGGISTQGNVYAGGSFYGTVDAIMTGNVSGNYVTGNLVTNNLTPLSTDPGIPGQIVFDTSYIYVCIANGSWKRANLNTY